MVWSENLVSLKQLKNSHLPSFSLDISEITTDQILFDLKYLRYQSEKYWINTSLQSHIYKKILVFGFFWREPSESSTAHFP